MFADLVVIRGADGDPWDHLIDATEPEVDLVVIHGKARYGALDHMNAVNAELLELVTRTMARQMLSLAGKSRPEDAELDRAQQDIMRSSWILFLGLIPAVGLLIYELTS